MAQVKVLQFPDGTMQIFVDGEDVDFETAERLTTQLLARLNAVVPGGVKQTSAVEQHKPGGLRHAHVTQELRRG
jgi:hypothetical protein